MSAPRDSDSTETDFRYEYPAEETPVEAVVGAVAEATGRAPLDLDPLGETVDADALNAILDGRSSVTVSFRYAGHRVTAAAGVVRVVPLDRSDETGD